MSVREFEGSLSVTLCCTHPLRPSRRFGCILGGGGRDGMGGGEIAAEGRVECVPVFGALLVMCGHLGQRLQAVADDDTSGVSSSCG